MRKVAFSSVCHELLSCFQDGNSWAELSSLSCTRANVCRCWLWKEISFPLKINLHCIMPER